MSMQLISNGYVTEAEGQIDYSAKTPRMAMTMSVPASGQGDMRTVVVDNTMYVALPTGGKEASEVYYELDLRDEDNPLVKQLGGLSSFDPKSSVERSEEHTSELQSLMRISYAVFCLKKKTHYDDKQYSNL